VRSRFGFRHGVLHRCAYLGTTLLFLKSVGDVNLSTYAGSITIPNDNLWPLTDLRWHVIEFFDVEKVVDLGT
jgi:hypothetical protein